jgi:molybdopterin synthase sulfur carrier subunit
VKLGLRVKFFANLRNVTKVKEVEVEEAGNIELLLNKLVEMYGDQFRNAIFDDDGKLRKFFKFLHNGRDIDFEQGLKTKLEREDVVAIFPPAGGG